MSTSCQWQLNIAYYTRNDTATSCHWQLKQLCKQLTLQTTSRQDIYRHQLSLAPLTAYLLSY